MSEPFFKRGKQNNPLKGIAVKYQFVDVCPPPSDVLGVSSVNKVCQLVREEGPQALPAYVCFSIISSSVGKK